MISVPANSLEDWTRSPTSEERELTVPSIGAKMEVFDRESLACLRRPSASSTWASADCRAALAPSYAV
jgi:hypothetical protein